MESSHNQNKKAIKAEVIEKENQAAIYEDDQVIIEVEEIPEEKLGKKSTLKKQQTK